MSQPSRDRLTQAVNASLTEMRALAGSLPVLVSGQPLPQDVGLQALYNAELLSRAALRYTRYLAALSALDGQADT